MKEETMFTPKQVGERIKERRIELKLSMPELGKRIGVNKSTIQRYEADGVDPKRTMIINGLAEALLTTPEWLTGLSDDKEYDSYTLCQKDIEQHINYLASIIRECTAEVAVTVTGRVNAAPILLDTHAIVSRRFRRHECRQDRIATVITRNHSSLTVPSTLITATAIIVE